MLSRLACAFVLLTATACDLQPPPKDQGGGAPAMVDPSTMNPGSAGSAAPAAPMMVPDAAGAAQPSTMEVTRVNGAPGDGGVPVVPVVATPPDAAAPAAVSDECLAITDKIAGVMINGTADPGQKAALEQDRTKLVRRMAEACSRDHWGDATMKCFTAAKTVEAIQACSTTLAAP